MTRLSHPSGRPIKPAPSFKPTMAPPRFVGFATPRLNGPELPPVNTYACGFMDHRPERPELIYKTWAYR